MLPVVGDRVGGGRMCVADRNRYVLEDKKWVRSFLDEEEK
jgi:hypothetical protein